MENMSYFEDSLKNIKHPNVIFSIDSVIQKMFLLDKEVPFLMPFKSPAIYLYIKIFCLDDNNNTQDMKNAFS